MIAQACETTISWSFKCLNRLRFKLTIFTFCLTYLHIRRAIQIPFFVSSTTLAFLPLFEHNCLEPESYQDLFQILEFQECQDIFFRAGWNPFLHLLQGYDEDILLLFVKGFDGKMARVGFITFSVTKETIVVATKIPREGNSWHKNLFLP